MRASTRRVLARALANAVGMVAVGLGLAWSMARPDRRTVLVEGLASFALGTTAIGSYERHSWSIRNDGRVPLTLRTKFTSGRCGFSLWMGEDHAVPAGGQITVWLTCPSPTRGDTPYAGIADVATSDPHTPRLRFRVFGITAASPSEK